ncbi:MAG: hypothetical protein M3P51_11435 [Chloroflexota bacterium]|nr:hypothetical protein [Chloroflexota bacterium]
MGQHKQSKSGIHAGFVLGAPGTYVEDRGEYLIIGNRPGMFHYVIAITFALVAIWVLWLLWPYAPLVAGGFFHLFSVPPLLILFNSQRWEITPGSIRMRGRAPGRTRSGDWLLPADSRVRIDSIWDSDEGSSGWYYQAQKLTESGWVGVAESRDAEVVRRFGHRLAEVTGASLSN